MRDRRGKPLVWLRGELRTPPLSRSARVEAGYLLRRLQLGETLSMPHSRPMPAIGPRCHELRIVDADLSWRVLYRLDADAVIVLDAFAKKTAATPVAVLAAARRRLKDYDDADGET